MKDMLVYGGHMYQFCKHNVSDDYYRCCMSRSATVPVTVSSISNYSIIYYLEKYVKKLQVIMKI